MPRGGKRIGAGRKPRGWVKPPLSPEFGRKSPPPAEKGSGTEKATFSAASPDQLEAARVALVSLMGEGNTPRIRMAAIKRLIPPPARERRKVPPPRELQHEIAALAHINTPWQGDDGHPITGPALDGYDLVNPLAAPSEWIYSNGRKPSHDALASVHPKRKSAA